MRIYGKEIITTTSQFDELKKSDFMEGRYPMKKADRIVQLLLPNIENKTILEVACGCADFSIAASSYASKVFCIDIVDSRLVKQDNIYFEIMDASMMRYPDEMFDSIYPEFPNII